MVALIPDFLCWDAPQNLSLLLAFKNLLLKLNYHLNENIKEALVWQREKTHYVIQLTSLPVMNSALNSLF